MAREEKRDVGIYSYYAPPRKDKDKREVGIYSYYAPPKKDKEKRDVGIYSYYAPPRKDKDKREGVEKRSPQDFADDAPAKEWTWVPMKHEIQWKCAYMYGGWNSDI